MEKKLTIEKAQLMAYMPYELKVVLTEHKDSFEGEDYYDDKAFSKGAIWDLSGYADPELNIPMGEGEINGFILSSGSTYISIISGFKPLLLPLSELNKPLMCKGEPSFIPASRYDLKLHDGQWCDIHYAEYGETPKAYVPICDINTWMFKYHFDVFSLIPQNLAIDKRTIK